MEAPSFVCTLYDLSHIPFIPFQDCCIRISLTITCLDITGSQSSTHALLILYDIFGYYPQTLQGADILASSNTSDPDSGSEHPSYLVIMPDFFNGSPADYSWYPPDTPEKEEKLNAFLAGPGDTEKTLTRISTIKQEVQTMFPQIEKWALVGYCWGGYVGTYASAPGTTFQTCVQLHSGFTPPGDAAKISIPTLMLLSKDELHEAERAPFEDAFGTDVGDGKEVKNSSKIIEFGDMIHGWMSARADLEDEKAREGYKRGYEIVIEWLRERFA